MKKKRECVLTLKKKEKLITKTTFCSGYIENKKKLEKLVNER